MKLVVYTLPYSVCNEAEKINNLFDEGLDELHIRKCRSCSSDTENLLKKINPKFLDRIVLHMNYNLATKYKLKGIHVSKGFFRGILGYIRKKALNPDLEVYTSVSNCNEIDELDFSFKSVLLGPLFKRFSAEYASKNFNSFELNKVLRNTKQSIFAMGGIDLSNFQELESFNFKAIVLQSSIWKSDNYLNAFNAFSLKKASKADSVAVEEALELKVG